MDLYRIILVDDEEEVRKSIIRKIDWQSVGFTVVGDAENGEDALEKIENLEPDVVLRIAVSSSTFTGFKIYSVTFSLIARFA